MFKLEVKGGNVKMRKSQTGVKSEISELSNVSSPFFFPFRTIVRFSNDDAFTRKKKTVIFDSYG